MATINFKIRPTKNTGASIYLIFSYGRRNELRYSTGLKVLDINNWNENKQIVKNVVAEPNAKSINKKIKQIHVFFEKKYQDLIDSNIDVTNIVLKNELDIYFNKRKVKESATSYKPLLDCFKWYYTHFEKNPLPTTKKPLTNGTIRPYKTSYKVLKEFNDNIYAINYNQITIDFYYNYLDFLKEKGFANNYISSHIKMLKTIMNFAWEKKFHNNLDFKLKAFTKISEDVNSIYLTDEELERITKLSLKGSIENARDLFIIACYTGLRVSDFNRLSKEHIKSVDGINYIEIKTKKTGRTVAIPVNKIIQKILNKRGGKPPRTMPEQHINKFLKIIGSDADIKEMVSIEKTKGGKKTVIKTEKYNLITNHTARRSFCTNAYKAKVPVIDIMEISGHKSEKVFYQYIKITSLERLKKNSEHLFFN